MSVNLPGKAGLRPKKGCAGQTPSRDGSQANTIQKQDAQDNRKQPVKALKLPLSVILCLLLLDVVPWGSSLEDARPAQPFPLPQASVSLPLTTAT